MPFQPKKFIDSSVAEAKKELADHKAIIAVSGGVDSAVAADIVAKAIGQNLLAVYVDTGLMRLNERENVERNLKAARIHVKVVDASGRFFEKLRGVEEPEKKRKIIGELFIRIFEEEAKHFGAEFLVQGTIAPDRIESGVGAGTQTIKSHHNVAGLPSGMKLKLFEPLKDAYKHEVRMLARELGMPPSISERQPFPGPGLAVRIVGEVTPERAELVRRACAVVEEEIEKAVEEKKMERPWQYFAALLPTKTVGVQGDERAYKYVCVVRAVGSLDGMTANYAKIPHEVLERISSRITNEIRGIGRVVYDVTNKPPGTIELE